jgi:prolyl-tRNA synthetase
MVLWEAIQRGLDERIKATGHVNAYFPLLEIVFH